MAKNFLIFLENTLFTQKIESKNGEELFFGQDLDNIADLWTKMPL